MLTPFGTSSIVALLQGQVSGGNLEVFSAWGGTMTLAGPSFVLITVNSMPATTPVPATEDTTGINQNNVICQVQRYAEQPGTKSINYGPNTGSKPLQANQILVSFFNSLGSPANPAGVFSFVVTTCFDGGFGVQL